MKALNIWKIPFMGYPRDCQKERGKIEHTHFFRTVVNGPYTAHWLRMAIAHKIIDCNF